MPILGVVMDPIGSINIKKDTTLALLQAANKAGFIIKYMEMSDLYLDQGIAKADVTNLLIKDDPQSPFELGTQENIELAQVDVILMRKDPPFDNQYIYATYILEAAERAGCLVVNKPQSLRDCNEKVFATEFPQCCPPVLISRKESQLKEFHNQHKDVIFKPLDGMGGSGIFRCKEDDPNVSVIIETLTEHESGFIMAQKFIPEISNGDKRVLVVNGKAIPYALARIPAEGETRGNLAAGGSGVAQPLSERDHWIVNQIAPTLLEKGLLFVGLDIIGDYLTEINVTSPTCVREIDSAYDTNIGDVFIKAIVERLDK
ncbi:glutathione synthase [Agarilytica rhodophyticola]|uniref:glutathione synthase n=1 Tax=Agarilytica rhodophyticola TaxID=1737490 RepID=UPI000B3479D4|nr:glutathione synthase [Agarilytica rhodophyticola]